MALTSSEVEALRFHLRYGNVDVGAYPYTPDGFKELFNQVVAPNLTTEAETTATTDITPGTVVVTPTSMIGIAVNVRLVVDVGDEAEVVVAKSATATTFSATFKLAHAGGYPIAVESGVARLRLLLHSAGKAWDKLKSSSITQSAGLKGLGKGQIEWFQGGQVLRDTANHYRAIVAEISSLVRVPVADDALGASRGAIQTEAY
jgi:hypothetical protein